MFNFNNICLKIYLLIFSRGGILLNADTQAFFPGSHPFKMGFAFVFFIKKWYDMKKFFAGACARAKLLLQKRFSAKNFYSSLLPRPFPNTRVFVIMKTCRSLSAGKAAQMCGMRWWQ